MSRLGGSVSPDISSSARPALVRVGRRSARFAVEGYVALRTTTWSPRSRLFVVGDDIGWSIDEDARFTSTAARQLGYEVAPASWARYARGQSVFLPDHFAGLAPRWLESSHELGLAYLHGRPGTRGYPEFDEVYERLRRDPNRIARVQVTHAEMRDLVLGAGVDPGRVFTIRLGVDAKRFSPAHPVSRSSIRESLGLPSSAFVVGSFQKDGVGFGEGLEPKLIKGPDVLLATFEAVRARVPDLFVLLTGIARGYVRAGLERLGIPYQHVFFASLDELAAAYHALDAYVVTSRQEGGPKGALEAMASGIPVVTTRVGQTQELVDNERNGLLVDVDEVDALADAVVRIHDDDTLRLALRRAGRETAARLDQRRLVRDWASLFDGFVERPAPAERSVPVSRRGARAPADRLVPMHTRRRVALAVLAAFLILIVVPEKLGDWPYNPLGKDSRAAEEQPA